MALMDFEDVRLLALSNADDIGQSNDRKMIGIEDMSNIDMMCTKHIITFERGSYRHRVHNLNPKTCCCLALDSCGYH